MFYVIVPGAEQGLNLNTDWENELVNTHLLNNVEGSPHRLRYRN